MNLTQDKTQKIIYRGQVYNSSRQLIATSSKKTVKLNYRGQNYEKISNPIVFDSKNTTRLIYRGQTYNYTPSISQRYCQPRAINWRFKV